MAVHVIDIKMIDRNRRAAASAISVLSQMWGDLLYESHPSPSGKWRNKQWPGQ